MISERIQVILGPWLRENLDGRVYLESIEKDPDLGVGVSSLLIGERDQNGVMSEDVRVYLRQGLRLERPPYLARLHYRLQYRG